jgi:NADPH:quinone reductase-like Zn-dependent oxidoreductase
MKAAVCPRYGSPAVLEFQELTKPIPKSRELLIRVFATTVSTGDCRVRGANFPRGLAFLARLALGWSGPRKPVLGTELAGVIEAVGTEVTRFKAGDAVIAFAGMKFGGHAEYQVMPEDGALAIKPESLPFDQAASLAFGGLTALYFLRDRARIQPQESVLVVGASGAVGSAAVQLARHFGADVTGVCSGKNVELVRSLGAQRVIDYTQTDLAQVATKYDIILDTTGTLSTQDEALLNDKGRLILVNADLPQMLESLWKPLKNGKKIITGNSSERAEDLRYLVDLAMQGVYKPVLDRSFSFAQIAEAHAFVETGRKRGSVVVTMP